MLTGIFMALSLAWLVRPFFKGSGSDVPMGKALPGMTLRYIANGEGTLRLDALGGKPALVTFWEPWCGYCVEEMPALARLHQRWTARGALVLAVSGEDLRESLGFIQRPSNVGLTQPFLFDAGGRLGRSLGVRKLPFAVFLDKHGKVAHTTTGVMSEADADAELAKLVDG